MSRVAYVNGTYQPHGQAVVHIEDRGFQFADGVYEVWSVFDGKLADFDGHMTRLHRSLNELRIAIPMTAEALKHVLKETVRRNRVRNGIVYLQVTRGVARRVSPAGYRVTCLFIALPRDHVAPMFLSRLTSAHAAPRAIFAYVQSITCVQSRRHARTWIAKEGSAG